MAFLVNRTVLEETLADNYDIGSGSTEFTSSKMFDMKVFSVQIISTNFDLPCDVNIKLLQSNDGVNFDDIDNSSLTVVTNDSMTIERSNFSGKFIRVELDVIGINRIGNISVYLIAKR